MELNGKQINLGREKEEASSAITRPWRVTFPESERAKIGFFMTTGMWPWLRGFSRRKAKAKKLRQTIDIYLGWPPIQSRAQNVF